MDKDAIETIFNFLPVDERLASSGQPREGEVRALARAGFEVVINLGLHDDPRYSLPDEEGLVRSLGMQYEHIPVDFAKPAEKNLQDFFSAMDRYNKKKVLVHCAANKRVSVFLGLYFALRKDQDAEKAFALMRDVWEPDETWQSFISEMMKKRKG
jgi:protein tyrosine phosphatase (PTP) superfamily phosphohydrolase (DUF442 family)